MAQREYVQKEWRLLSWWLALRHPNADIWMNVRLGALKPRQLVSAAQTTTVGVSRVFHRYADAVFIENGEPWIVEAKLEPDPGIYSQLIHYARKFRMDPDWQAYREKQLRLVALVYNDDPEVSTEAPFYGITWEVFQPNLQELAPPQVLAAFGGSTSEPPPLPSNWPSRLGSWGIRAMQGAG